MQSQCLIGEVEDESRSLFDLQRPRNFVPVVLEVLLLGVGHRIGDSLPGSTAAVPDERQLLVRGRTSGGLLDVLGVVVQDDRGDLTGLGRIHHVRMGEARLGQTVGFLHGDLMDLKDAERLAVVADGVGLTVGLDSDQSLDQARGIGGGRDRGGEEGEGELDFHAIILAKTEPA